MSESLKKVATDIKVFSDFIINDCYYVDKTKYIKTIMEDGSASILFTRPRRFGKSITISMLQSFLEMNYENPSDKSKQIALFKDTEIFKDKEFCDKYMGQYPVIFLSLKEAWDTNSYEDALQSLYEELSNSVEKFNFLLDCDKLSAEKIQKLKNILTISDNALSPVKKKAVAERMIRELTQDLLVYTGKECIVLIDEYDVPLSKAANTDFYQKIRDFISKLFSSALKNNESLKKGIITGCLRVAKESIFTGLNNFYSCGLDNYDYSKLFGFTTDEVTSVKAGYDGIKINYISYYKGSPSNVNQSNGFVKTKLGQGNPFGSVRFGPEVGIAETLHNNNYDDKVVLIKCAVGASYLAPEANEWMGEAPYYKQFTSLIDKSLSQLIEDGYNPKIKAFCWMQGEADSANSAYISKYSSNLETFVQQFRTRYASYQDDNGFGFIDGYICTSSVLTHAAEINQQKQNYADSHGRSVTIDTNAAGSKVGDPGGDKYHYNVYSEFKLGKLFGEEIINFIK